MGVLLSMLVVIGAAGGAVAGEFYGWSDPSGTMVLTDNPNRIPPAAQQGPVAVYQFKESPPAVQPERPVRVARAHDPYAEDILAEPEHPSGHWSERAIEPIHPAEVGLPEVLLDAPDDPVKAYYIWVPFVVPVSLGGEAVSGFWCHRDATSPILAFKQFLAQNQALLQTLVAVMTGPQRHGDMVYHRSLLPLPPVSGNPVRLHSRPATIPAITALPARMAAFHPDPRIGTTRSGFRR